MFSARFLALSGGVVLLNIGICLLLLSRQGGNQGGDDASSNQSKAAKVMLDEGNTQQTGSANDSLNQPLARNLERGELIPPGMDLLGNYFKTGDIAYLVAASPGQFDHCAECRKFILQRVSEIAASPQAIHSLLNWLVTEPSSSRYSLVIELAAALETAVPGSASSAFSAEQIATLPSPGKSEELLSLVKSPYLPNWFFEDAARRAGNDPTFAKLVLNSLKQAPTIGERERLVSMMGETQLLEAIQSQAILDSLEFRQVIFSRIGSNPSIESIQSVLQVFRSADWQIASDLGKSWANAQLSGARLTEVDKLLDTQTLSQVDRKAIAFMLRHAEDGPGATAIINRRQLYN